MRQQINGHYVPDQMIWDLKAIKRVGGKAYLVVGDKAAQGCSNCNGCGHIHLQTVVGGPYDYQPISIANNKQTTVPTTINGKWYQVRTKGYTCPVCGGEQVVSQLDEDIRNENLDALAGDMKIGWHQD